MGRSIQGAFYSNTITTSGDGSGGEDLITDIKTTLGLTSMVVKKLTLISSSNISVDINNLGTYSKLFADADGNYKLSLDSLDCSISSVKILEKSVAVWIAVVF
jgi:hypothetical protein